MTLHSPTTELPRIMSNRVEDPTSLFRQFLNTLSRIPSTTSQDQLDKLTKMQKVLAKEENLISDQDLAKRERLVKEYEDELRKSSKQSQSVPCLSAMILRVRALNLTSGTTGVDQTPRTSVRRTATSDRCGIEQTTSGSLVIL